MYVPTRINWIGSCGKLSSFWMIWLRPRWLFRQEPKGGSPILILTAGVKEDGQFSRFDLTNEPEYEKRRARKYENQVAVDTYISPHSFSQ